MSANGLPENMVFGLDIGTRSIVGTVGYKADENNFTVVAQHTKFQRRKRKKRSLKIDFLSA